MEQVNINVTKVEQDVTINATPNVTQIIVTTQNGGGAQNLNDVLSEGNETDGENIFISDGDEITFDNGSRIRKGLTDAGNGGAKGVALVCSLDYELKWEAGRQYVMQQDGFTIREVSHNFTITPSATDDSTKGFAIDSRWILDNGDVYVCTDATEDSAVWELQVIGGAVDSVNGKTGVVVLDADDIDDTSTTNKFTTATDISKLAGIEANADVTDSTNVNAAGAVMNSDYSSHSILVQQSGSGSPTSLGIGNNTLIGRLSGGGSDINDLSVSQVKGLLNFTTPTDVQTIADAKVTNAIVDGVTTIAPSQNAVFDALALKQNNLTETNFGTFSNSLTDKNTLIDADQVVSVDSADSNKSKKTSWLNVWNNFIKSKTDALYATIASLALKLDIASPSYTGLMTGVGTTQTGSSAIGVVNLSQTWNTTGNPTLIRANVTNTASGTNSNLLEFFVNSTSVFRINRVGGTTISSSLTVTGNLAGTFYSSTGGFSSMVANYDTGVAAVTGNYNGFGITRPFNPTSGVTTYNGYHFNATINQTGGANGITRGLFINPTLTSAADFRAIDVVNGSVVLPYRAETSNYAIRTSDYLINITSGIVTATLPTAVGCTGKHYIIKNTGASVVTVATTSSQTIDGVTTATLGVVNKYIHVVSTGANWIVIANN
jgi:hypothetical protein